MCWAADSIVALRTLDETSQWRVAARARSAAWRSFWLLCAAGPFIAIGLTVLYYFSGMAVAERFGEDAAVVVAPLWFLGLPLVGPIGAWLVCFWVYRRRVSRVMRGWIDRGVCVVCGYDLSTLSTGRCPECGRPNLTLLPGGGR